MLFPEVKLHRVNFWEAGGINEEKEQEKKK